MRMSREGIRGGADTRARKAASGYRPALGVQQHDRENPPYRHRRPQPRRSSQLLLRYLRPPRHAQDSIEDQGVKAALLTIGQSELELLEPTRSDSAVGRFLERKGEGLHHICFQTPNVDAELDALKRKGVELVDQTPRRGLAGMICFLHPKASKGVLVELATPID